MEVPDARIFRDADPDILRARGCGGAFRTLSKPRPIP
jgi:hypothetical protein